MRILPTAKGIGQAIHDIGGTGTMTVLAGIGGFVFLTTIIGVDFIFNDDVPSEGWVIPYSFCAAFAGVGAAIKGVHRATAKPEIVRAEAEAEAEKVLAVAKADVVRRTGEMQAVRDDGDRPVLTDHDRGVV